MNVRHVSDDRHQVLIALGLTLDDGIAVLGILVGDAFYHTPQMIRFVRQEASFRIYASPSKYCISPQALGSPSSGNIANLRIDHAVLSVGGLHQRDSMDLHCHGDGPDLSRTAFRKISPTKWSWSQRLLHSINSRSS